MGNVLNSGVRKNYQAFEGGLYYSGLVAFLIVIAAVLLALLCLFPRHFSKWIHTMLASVVFQNLITVSKEDEKQKVESQTATNEEEESRNEEVAIDEEVLLFDGKEIDKNTPWGKKCATCYTYFYFTAMGVLTFAWFFIILMDSIVYRKTTTCNDINVEDTSFTCYDINNRSFPTIDCTLEKERERERNASIFCYLYNFNVNAFGAANGFAGLIIFLTSLYFKILTAIAQQGKQKIGGCIFDFKVIVVLAQIAIGVVWAAVMIAIIPRHHKEGDIYFFRGLAVLRVSMYPLGVITGVVAIGTPWCFFTKKSYYTTKVHFIDKDSKLTPPPKGSDAPGTYFDFNTLTANQ